MFAQGSCFMVVVLVAGALCAPSPGIYRVGFTHGVSGRTAVIGGAHAKADIDHGVVNGTGYAKLGGSGSGTVGGSLFAQANDKIVEAVADYHGSAGGWGRADGKGEIGRDSRDGRMVLGGSDKLSSNGEHSGAGFAGIQTNEDALHTFNDNHSRDADDVLSEIDDF